MKDIEEGYGDALENWRGDMEPLEGVQTIVHRLMFATDAPGADLGPLAETAVSVTFAAAPESEAIGAAIEAAESQPYGEAWATLLDLEPEVAAVEPAPEVAPGAPEATAGPGAELDLSDLAAELAREVGDLAEDMGFRRSLHILNEIIRAAGRAREQMELSGVWPVAEIAIKSEDPEVLEAVETFKRILKSRSRAKTVTTIPLGGDWDKLHVEMETHLQRISEVHRLWARKIEMLLRAQDPWKIWQSMKDGEYAVGIEGQRVVIDADMLSFTTSLRPGTVEESFPLGTLYMDLRLNEDLFAEGYALEVMDRVDLMKEELKLGADEHFEVRVWAQDRIRAYLEAWRDKIAQSTGAAKVKALGEDVQRGASGLVMDWRVEGEPLTIQVKRAIEAT